MEWLPQVKRQPAHWDSLEKGYILLGKKLSFGTEPHYTYHLQQLGEHANPLPKTADSSGSAHQRR